MRIQDEELLIDNNLLASHYSSESEIKREYQPLRMRRHQMENIEIDQ